MAESAPKPAVTPLFPKPVPIIGGTGEFESGKTLFGLTICPGPQTLYYDFEQSGASYGELGHIRVNVVEVMQKSHPNGYKPVDMFLWWKAEMQAIPAGKYRVIVIDPATDLERGLTDWVNSNPKHFGHTSGQYASMSGIMWGDVKDYWKSILADVSSRCEVLYYTAHVGTKFEGNQATKDRKVKGKSTLSELASLFLWFSRKPDSKGAKPNKPMAKVVKSRLMVMRAGADGEIEIQQVLPPIMPVATPNELRKAFANPAGGREIDELEKYVEEKMTEEEKLRLEVQKAEAERDSNLAKISAGEDSSAAGRPSDPALDVVHKRIADAKSSSEIIDLGKWISTLSADTRTAVKEAYYAKRNEIAMTKTAVATPVAATNTPAV